MSARLVDVMKTVVPYKAYAPLRSSFRFVAALKYRGTDYTCPFCGGRFARLMPGGFNFPVLREKQVIGAGPRENAVCPRCYSQDRERLVYLFLQAKQPEIFSEPRALLHVAPEPTLSAKFRACPRLKYLAADLDSHLADVQMDITAIGQPDASYDAIVCNHVLEHIPDDRKAMSELYRVLKPGGFAILQVPISATTPTYEDFTIEDPRAREEHFGQYDHVRIYGHDYVDRLRSVGFEVTTYAATDFLEAKRVREFALNPDERVYVATKPRS